MSDDKDPLGILPSATENPADNDPLGILPEEKRSTTSITPSGEFISKEPKQLLNTVSPLKDAQITGITTDKFLNDKTGLFDNTKARDIYYKTLGSKGFNEEELRKSGELTMQVKPEYDRLVKEANKNDGNEVVRGELANLQLRLGKYDDAINNYTSLIGKNAVQPEYYQGMAYALDKKGRKEEAQQYLAKSKELNGLSNGDLPEPESIESSEEARLAPQRERLQTIAKGMEELTKGLTPAGSLESSVKSFEESGKSFGEGKNLTGVLQGVKGLVEGTIGAGMSSGGGLLFNSAVQAASLASAPTDEIMSAVSKNYARFAEKLGLPKYEDLSENQKIGLSFGDLALVGFALHKIGKGFDPKNPPADISKEQIKEAAQTITPNETVATLNNLDNPKAAQAQAKVLDIQQGIENPDVPESVKPDLQVKLEEAKNQYGKEVENGTVADADVAHADTHAAEIDELTSSLEKDHPEIVKQAIQEKINQLNKPTDATKEVDKQEGVQPERESGNEIGQAAETSGGDSVLSPAQGEEKITAPTAEAQSNEAEINLSNNGEIQKGEGEQAQAKIEDEVKSSPEASEASPLKNEISEVDGEQTDHSAIANADQAHQFAKDNGFDAANHLLSSLNKSEGTDFKNIQEVPRETMKRFLEARKEKPIDRKFDKGITKEELKSGKNSIGVDTPFSEGLKQDFGKLADSAKEKIETGKINADDVAQDYADHPNKPISDENLAVLLTRKRQLQNAIEELDKARETATPEELVEINHTSAALQDKYETLLEGTNNATTTAGRALRSVQMALEKDFSLATMKAQLSGIKGSKLTEEESAHVSDLQKEIAEKTKIIDDYAKEKSERLKAEENKKAQATLEKFKKESTVESKRSIRSSSKEYLKKEREGLFKQLSRIAKEQRSTLSANPIPVKMIPVLSKLAKNYIKDGILTANEIAEKIHEGLKDFISGVTTDHVKESLFGKKETIQLDREEMAKRAAQKKAQEKFDLLKKKYQQDKRPTSEYTRDLLLKWQRFAILSGVKTLGKLTAAATARQFLTSTIEEGIGWGISKILPKKLIKGAAREGGYNLKAEAKNITEAFKKATYKDILQTAKTGKGELDLLYGKGQLSPESLDFFGQLHSALKTMPKRGEFFRSFEKRMQHAIEMGADGTNPIVQTEIAAKAYEDGMRTIFMNENAIVSGHNAFLKILENKGYDATATVTRLLLPIVKIPSNFAAETTSYLGGAMKAAWALRKGIEKLTPDQKDYVVRNLKKQTLGATLMAVGYFNYENVGGYYQQGEKRDDEDTKPGDVKIFGIEIPHLYLHAPALEMLQFGATIHRIQDRLMDKNKDNPIAGGVGKAIWGLSEQQPFIGEANRLITDLKYKGFDQAAINVVNGFLVPKLIQEIASGMDKEELTPYTFFFGDPIERKPTNIKEEFEMGVPGLRQNVPEK